MRRRPSNAAARSSGSSPDTLWAEQSVSYEVTRMMDGIRSLGRQMWATNSNVGDEMRARMRSVMQRDQAILSLHIWSPRSNEFPYSSASTRDPDEERIREAALRAKRLGRPATLEVPGANGSATGDATQMLFAMPLDSGEDQVAVAVVSLQRLLQNTIPWWLAHNTQITLEDTSGNVLARRDENVHGRGVYTHKIATAFVDRSLYLNANSSQGTPFLIPNLLALSIACLSLLLAWTVYELWRDLGKRTRAEAALRAQQALQTAMEHSLITGLRARDMQGRITYANPAFCEMVGCSLNELLQMRPPMPYWAPSVAASAQERHEEQLAGTFPNRSFESRFVRPGGDTIDVLMHEAPLLDGSGTQIGWMASVQDISEQKRNAELLRVQGDRIQKMARLMTMGEMASALAHELNQPLAAATSYITAGLNMVNDPLHDGASVQAATDYFGKARTQTNRAGEIIKRVRQFVGHSVPALARLDAREVIKDLLPLIRLQAGDADSAVVMRLDRPLPAVLADRVLLEQIILNLTKNAFEAMSTLKPAHKRVEIFGELLRSGGGAPLVLLGVRDRGPGLGERSEQILSSTLTTTKPGGLGMGLAICRKASELLGTTLEYQAAPGGGAQFQFTLRAAV